MKGHHDLVYKWDSTTHEGTNTERENVIVKVPSTICGYWVVIIFDVKQWQDIHPLGLKINMATWIFITALVFLEVVIQMNVVFIFFFFFDRIWTWIWGKCFFFLVMGMLQYLEEREDMEETVCLFFFFFFFFF